MFTFPYGKPLERPGVYRILNTINGKSYIGISVNMLRRMKQHAYDKSTSKLQRAKDKYGTEALAFIPLFYSFDQGILEETEERLIIEFDTVVNGYNINEVSRGRSYGKQFGERIKLALASEKCKANRAATNAKPEVKKRRADAQLLVIASGSKQPAVWPQELRNKMAENIRTRWQNEEYRRKCVEGMLAKSEQRVAAMKNTIANNDEYKAKKSATMKAQWQLDAASRSAAIKKTRSSPESRAKTSAAIRARYADPVVQEAQREKARLRLEAKKRVGAKLGIYFRNVTSAMIAEHDND